MDSEETTFAVGDRVFAKLAGHRAWPAQITEKRADGEYCVAFYGTHEIAYVKQPMIHPYNEINIKKFASTPKKSPSFRNIVVFNAGMEEIATGVNFVPIDIDENRVELKNGSVDANITDNNRIDNDDDDDSMSIDEDEKDDEMTTKTPNTSLPTPPPLTPRPTLTPRPRGRPPKSLKMNTSRPPKAVLMETEGATFFPPPQPPPSSHQNLVSRHGRTIKPKRFADDTDEIGSPVSVLAKAIKASNETKTVIKASNEAKAVIKANNEAKAVIKANNEAKAVIKANNDAKAVIKTNNYAKMIIKSNNVAKAVVKTSTEAQVVKASNETKAVVKINPETKTALMNGKPHQQRKVGRPVVKARAIMKVQQSPSTPPAPVVAVKAIQNENSIVENKSLKPNDSSNPVSQGEGLVSKEEEDELDKLSEEQLKERLKKLTWEDERIDLLLKLMDSASSKRCRCETSAELLMKLGSPGYIDAAFLKEHPETVEIVRKMSRFVGNPVQWRMTKPLREQLEVKALKIRKTAEATFEHFKSLFQTNIKPLAVQLMEEMNRLNSES